MNANIAKGLDHSKTFEVIESKRWVRNDGRTASVYGASPYTDEAERSQWQVKVVGFTVRHLKTGTVGIGCQPWPTRDPAESRKQAVALVLNRTPDFRIATVLLSLMWRNGAG